MEGYIHSLESFGTVDGPGIRFVTFFQGCPLRCLYCHNPDSWKIEDGTKMQASVIIDKIVRNRSFYKTGGLTATGGEPLLQIDFLIHLFTLAKENGISTCLDTSGILFDANQLPLYEKFLSLVKVTDLVLLDIKHMFNEEHVKLTGQSNEKVFAFAQFLEEQKVHFWVRHVVVPTITDKKEELEALGTYLARFTYLDKIEILKYHTMAKSKYENLSMDYPLEGVPQLTKVKAKEAEEIVLLALRTQKEKNNS